MAKKIFTHYMPSLPIALDDIEPSTTPGDYYKRNYLTQTGEGGIHATYGGFLRDAPAARTDVTRPVGGDYVLSDMAEEIRRAKSYGVDGFSVDLLNLSGSANHTRAQSMLTAADADGTFKILLVPDMTSSSVYNLTQQVFVDAIVDLAAHASAYDLPDGRLVLAPFMGTWTGTGTSKPVSWWTQVISMLGTAGYTVALIPMVNTLSTAVMDAFDATAAGYAPWGSRDPLTSAALSGLSVTMRARSGNSSKIWMGPVSFQDARPQQRTFYEANGTQNLRDTWTQAIASGTLTNDMVQLVTWNDYVEGAYFGPSRRNSGAALKISQYYGTKFKTGSFPTPTVDSATVLNRSHMASPVAVLTAARNAGTAYTTIACQALASALSVGDKLHFTTGQYATVSAAAAASATSITVSSFTPTATYASGVAVTKRTWTYVPPSDNYGPMVNRRWAGSATAKDTVNIVEVYTLLTASADVTATIGGVAQTPYTAPAGENVQTFTAAVGAAPSVSIVRSAVPILSVTSSTAISATPVVQDLTYATAYAENPPIVPPVEGTPTAVRIQQASDTAAALVTANPVLKLGEVAWESATTGATPRKYKVGNGSTAWNSLPYVSDTVLVDALMANSFPVDCESTMSRDLQTLVTLGNSSGQIRLGYFTAMKSQTVNSLRVQTGITTLATGLTLCKFGIYSVDPSTYGLTLVASTASDTTMLAAANTEYTKALTTPWSKVAGQRYALGVLQVGTTAANLTGLQGSASVGTRAARQLRRAALLPSQTDLPSTITDASLTSTTTVVCVDAVL